MSPEEVLAEFTELELVDGSTILYVKEIDWDGPYTPVTSRTEIARFDAEPTAEELEAARRSLLQKRRYFGRCTRCQEWNPAGWMHDRTTCQSCAERFLGVVY